MQSLDGSRRPEVRINLYTLFQQNQDIKQRVIVHIHAFSKHFTMAPSRVKKILLLESIALKVNRKKLKRSWVHEINICRKSFGEFYHLYRDARKYPEKFYEYLRMSKESFDLLLSHLDPYLCGIGTNFRERISAEQRLVITLRFLATGESYRSLALHFRLGVATVSNIVNHTCMNRRDLRQIRNVRRALAAILIRVPTHTPSIAFPKMQREPEKY
ncbi:unnamed protein product [Acanthoscelides obtectus]|uniref:Transposase Helix-turn-helix domain-containing protein n=1 Tax=Acanthoscelides obtectus TaxID=200917 RepID=A0A9P0L928_ACAOB|nr:unnamed protein product [Acanthoscelides obtectus]CAK1633032.1 hypothetical protein AOBTE_LOCUS7888 [Acanthoscelides obtectus]